MRNDENALMTLKVIIGDLSEIPGKDLLLLIDFLKAIGEEDFNDCQ